MSKRRVRIVTHGPANPVRIDNGFSSEKVIAVTHGPADPVRIVTRGPSDRVRGIGNSPIVIPTLKDRILGMHSNNLLWYYPLDETSGTTAINNAPGRSGINCVKIPGFEGTPWSKWAQFADSGTIYIDNTPAGRHSGTNGLGMLSGGVGKDTHVLQICKVTPGKSYTYKVWTFGDGTNSLAVRISKGDWSAYLVNASTGITGGTWAQYTVTFNNPVGNATVNLELAVPGAVGAYCYVDDNELYSNSPDATVFDAPYYGSPLLAQPGANGNSVEFNGSQCVNLDLPAFDSVFPGLMQGGSCIIYGKPTLASLIDGVTGYLFKFKTYTAPFQYLDCFEVSLNNTLGMQYSDSGNEGHYKSYPWTTSVWLSMGATWSAANGFKMFVNGIQRDTTGSANGIWNDAFDYYSMAIGAGAVDAAANGWFGNLQHFAAWDMEFTPAEMLSIGVP